MPTITLPDGSQRQFANPVTGAEVAAAIGPGLAKAALAVKLNGQVKDLATSISEDAKVEIVTKTHKDALELLRHDAAHVLAEAVQELFPGTQITFGPATESGFYYDFHRAEHFTLEDFEKIEQRMREIVDRDEQITREVWSRDQAVAWFKQHGETFKAEWVASIPKDEEISIYKQGQWLDMCTGPHLPSTGKLGKAFKLMKLSGAYWRGDANNPQLQRIYGTVFADEKQLKEHLHQLEEAEKRDHRRLGREMNLFHQQEEAAGMVFWHPKGWTLYRTLENFIRQRLEDGGYQEVKTPQLVDRKLWEASGHWEKFRENMYLAENEDGIKHFAGHPDERIFALKPMNCPCHVQIFNQGLKSYRDLPLRLAEFGSCHRFEPSGALHGIMRVRNFTQDDAHIFCTPEQVKEESIKFCRLLFGIYHDCGFTDVKIRFADRPDKRAGSDAVWDEAEAQLKAAIEAANHPYEMAPGEGAFYGPKLEFHLKDTIGRTWQCGTLQMDFVLPERLDAHYVAEDGQKKRPVMLHRAIFGSMERFIGILIEHYAGHLPLWLSPQQAVVCTIVSDADDYARKVNAELAKAGLRSELDLRNEKINYKVREHSLAKIPLILAVGKRDQEAGTVAVRRLGEEGQKVMPLAEAIEVLKKDARVPG